MKKLNIFHISPFPFHSGGIDTWLFKFLELMQNHFEITLICPENTANLPPKFEIHSLSKVHFIYIDYKNRSLFSIISPAHIYQYYKKVKHINSSTSDINLILSTYPVGFLTYMLFLLKQLKGKRIMSVRGCVAQDMHDLNKNFFIKRMFFLLEKYSMKTANTLIANGLDTKEYIKDNFQMEATIIPNAISTADIKQSKKNRYDYLKAEGIKIFTHLGTLREIKNITEIINAVNIYHKTYNSKYLLIFAGKGRIEHYQNLAKKLGINAIFIDELSHNDIFDVLNISDVILNSSFGCGVSNSLLEAMLLGKITVAPNKKTFSQVITHTKNGYLYEYKNTRDYAKKIFDAVQNKEHLTPALIRKSIERYNWLDIKNQWVNLFNEN